MSEKPRRGSKSHRSNVPEKTFNCITSIPQPKLPKSTFFPEWADDEITLVSTSISSGTGKHARERGDRQDKNDDTLKTFEDPQVLFLPFCLHDMEHDWRRPQDAFPDYQFAIYTDEEGDYPDLLYSSAHLVNSAFCRSFITSIHNLEYLSRTTNFAQEAKTTKYVPNAGSPWRPWHHVYGGSKVGAGTVHNPQVNSLGKYFIRLFWLGAWRKVVVDDYLPVDSSGHVLLPSLPIPKKPFSATQLGSSSLMDSKEKHKTEKEVVRPTVVLWPFLLSKALLKLANLTMKKDEDLLDFSIVHCLTGWTLQKLELKGMSADDVWEICRTYTKLFTWDEEEETSNKPSVQKKQNHGLKVLYSTPKENTGREHYLMALCKDMRSLKQSAVNGMSPCWGHEIVIDECRNIPLERPPPQTEYPLWKTFRWTEWAKSEGLITESVPMDTTRYLKCVSKFRKFIKQIVYKEPSPELKVTQFPLRKSVAILQKQLLEQREKQEDAEIFLYQRPDNSKDKKIKQPPTEDPSGWIRFDELCAQLVSIYVFYKPSLFHHKARVSNLGLSDVVDSKEGRSNLQNLCWPNTLEERGNIPLYLYLDSLESKMILINLSQSGDLERLVPLEDELSEHNFFVEYERLFGNRLKNLDNSEIPPKKLKLNRARIHADLKRSNLIIEEFKWDSAETGRVKFFLNTYGSSSSMMELKPGRHVFRLWIKSEFTFCLTLLADTHFSLGCFEQILEDMATEPMRITQFSLNISDSFGRLIRSFGTGQFAEHLHVFHRSYLPEDALNVFSKSQRTILHEVFKRSLLLYLQFSRDFFSLQRIVEGLRTLFVDKNIRVPQAPLQSFKEPFQFQSLQEKIICERAAKKLGSFFKGVQVRMLLARHKPTNRYFSETYNMMKQLYAEIFSLDKRDECLGVIIRNFFQNETLSDLLDSYDVSREFKWDITVQTFSGSIELTRDYVVLTRFTLRCNANVVLAFHLFCSITKYALRIIDNDTGEEIRRFTNSVFPQAFKPNNFGYTVIGFAWYEDIKLIDWKLSVISARNCTTMFELEEVKTITTAAFDNYVPICKELIGKHTIFVRENVLLTLRFSCSYQNAKFQVKLYDPSRRKVMVDVVGVEKIVIPSVLLQSGLMETQKKASNRSMSMMVAAPRYSERKVRPDHRKSVDRPVSKKESQTIRKLKENVLDVVTSDFEPQVYGLEIYVLENSWPLTWNEWSVVRKLREESYFANFNANKDVDLLTTTSSSRNILKTPRDARRSMLKKMHAIEKPWYLLQYSFKVNAQMALIKDRTEEEKVLNLKRSWYLADPERYVKSAELRQNYLKKYVDPGCECPEEFWDATVNSPVVSVSRTTVSESLSYSNGANLTLLKEEDDESCAERTVKCPRWTEAEIPPFDLSPYYRPQCPCPLDVRRKTVKTKEDHIEDEKARREMIEEYEVSLMKRREEMEMWIEDSNERRILMFSWYTDCRKLSESIIEENHVMRENYFQRWAESMAPKPGKKAATKAKK